MSPQLRTVPGVTEVNTIGGYEKQYHVTPDPNRLIAYGLTFHDLILAIEANNAEAGGGYIERKGEQYLVSSSGRLRSPAEIEDVVVATRSGVPLRLNDVAVGRHREGVAYRRRDRERRRSRARHRVHADRREQPQRVAGAGRAARGSEPLAAARASSPRRSTTARSWSKRRWRRSRRICSKARRW